MSRLLYFLLVAGLFVSRASFSAGIADAEMESKIDGILNQLTLEEKVAMCLGASGLSFKGVPRLNIPDMRCVDGPRGPQGGFTTAFPAGIAFGATWNPDLIEQAAVVMGKETRALGASMLLGPGLNIQRDPLGGRFFEYYTEDPYLNARLAVAFVKGLQSQNVAACLKHFAVNNRERERHRYMSIVDRRVLEEIYFPAFKAAVQEANAWSVMTAANGLNGDFCSDSRFLLHDTLKQGWGFDGMVMTDWLNTRSTEKAAFAGLDVAMPYREDSLYGKPLLQAVRDGKVPETLVNDKTRRVLRTMGRVGLLDGKSPKSGGVSNLKEHHEISRRVAEDSIVLLKNEKQTLPLDAAHLKKILVVGPNANQRFCLPGLGGSSWQESEYEITPLQGIERAVGPDTKVQFISNGDLGGFQPIPAGVMQEQSGAKGFLAKYFNAGDSHPAVERVVPEVDFVWEMRSPDEQKVKPERFRAEFSGTIIPPTTGVYILRITVGGGNALVFGEPGGSPLTFCDAVKGVPSATAMVQMEAGKPFFLQVEYKKSVGDGACRVEWALPVEEEKRIKALTRLTDAAEEADAVLVFAGLDHSLDSESRDRSDMHFPEVQQMMIEHLVAANPKTIVTLINGSPLELGDWLDLVPAVVEAWYPGMEGGAAIANVLFGKTNPSGKLPFTWPKKLGDAPSHLIGMESSERIDYKEGLLVGYRYFDTKNIEPQFPFGYGLSYTTFDYSELHLVQNEGRVRVSVKVTNTGKVTGAETVQFYVSEVKPLEARPAHELKAFKKVILAPGESTEVKCDLNRDAFSYFSDDKSQWIFHPGEFDIHVGSSSRDIRQRANIFLQELNE